MTTPQGEPTPVPGAPVAPAVPASPLIAPPASPAAPAAPSPWDGFTWDGKVESLPPDVAKVIQDTRKEAAATRTNAKTTAAAEARNELIAQFAGFLGIGNAEPPTAEQLTQHLADSQAHANSMAAQMRIYGVAAQVPGMTLADVGDFLDSNRIAEEIEAIAEQIQPGDVAAFDAKVTEIMQRWHASRPQVSAPAASTTPIAALRPGALPGTHQPTVDDQIAEAQKAGNWREALRLQNSKLYVQH